MKAGQTVGEVDGQCAIVRLQDGARNNRSARTDDLTTQQWSMLLYQIVGNSQQISFGAQFLEPFVGCTQEFHARVPLRRRRQDVRAEADGDIGLRLGDRSGVDDHDLNALVANPLRPAADTAEMLLDVRDERRFALGRTPLVCESAQRCGFSWSLVANGGPSTCEAALRRKSGVARAAESLSRIRPRYGRSGNKANYLDRLLSVFDVLVQEQELLPCGTTYRIYLHEGAPAHFASRSTPRAGYC